MHKIPSICRVYTPRLRDEWISACCYSSFS